MTTENTNITLYLLDFDGTITTRDTLFLFCRYASGMAWYYFSFCLFIPVFMAMMIGILPKDKTKQLFLKWFLNNKSKNDLETLGLNFSRDVLPHYARAEAISMIQDLVAEKQDVAIVSASLDFWLLPFAKQYGVKLICTHAAYTNNIFKGLFEGNNCNYEEKAVRIKNEYNLNNFKEIIVYCDSKGDAAMMKLADKVHYKPFRNR